jgi:hypothetical protein
MGPRTVPMILPKAQNRAKRAEAFSLEPGRAPISSLTLCTSSDKMGMATEPEEIPNTIRPTSKRMRLILSMAPTPRKSIKD